LFPLNLKFKNTKVFRGCITILLPLTGATLKAVIYPLTIETRGNYIPETISRSPKWGIFSPLRALKALLPGGKNLARCFD
jgi:hypothetical protein